MHPYRNIAGDSGIVAYEIGDGWIRVKYRHSKDIYKYTDEKPGRVHVREMQKLARAGKGLSTYISQHVKNAYESKRRW